MPRPQALPSSFFIQQEPDLKTTIATYEQHGFQSTELERCSDGTLWTILADQAGSIRVLDQGPKSDLRLHIDLGPEQDLQAYLPPLRSKYRASVRLQAPALDGQLHVMVSSRSGCGLVLHQSIDDQQQGAIVWLEQRFSRRPIPDIPVPLVSPILAALTLLLDGKNTAFGNAIKDLEDRYQFQLVSFERESWLTTIDLIGLALLRKQRHAVRIISGQNQQELTRRAASAIMVYLQKDRWHNLPVPTGLEDRIAERLRAALQVDQESMQQLRSFLQSL